MSVVYPGLVNIDNSPITVTTINVYDDNQRTYTYDLTDQIPAWSDDPDGAGLAGQELIDAQAFLKQITLPSSARINTLIIILDGLTLSPWEGVNENQGDYKVINSTTVEFMWPDLQCPRYKYNGDTPVLLARYTLA
jgi:hypothetical protein